VALRTGKALEWDGEARRVTNIPEANALLRDVYRDGFSL
jgi:hypothetical protein